MKQWRRIDDLERDSKKFISNLAQDRNESEDDTIAYLLQQWKLKKELHLSIKECTFSLHFLAFDIF